MPHNITWETSAVSGQSQDLVKRVTTGLKSANAQLCTCIIMAMAMCTSNNDHSKASLTKLCGNLTCRILWFLSYSCLLNLKTFKSNYSSRETSAIQKQSLLLHTYLKSHTSKI